MNSDYYLHTILAVILGILLTKIKFLNNSIAYVIAVLLTALYIVSLISERVGYYDPFSPIFVIVSSPIALLVLWISDVAFDSLRYQHNIMIEFNKKMKDLQKSFIYFIIIFIVYCIYLSLA